MNLCLIASVSTDESGGKVHIVGHDIYTGEECKVTRAAASDITILGVTRKNWHVACTMYSCLLAAMALWPRLPFSFPLSRFPRQSQ